MIILYGAMYIIHRPLKIFIPMKDTLSAICILHKPLKIFIPIKMLSVLYVYFIDR